MRIQIANDTQERMNLGNMGTGGGHLDFASGFMLTASLLARAMIFPVHSRSDFVGVGDLCSLAYGALLCSRLPFAVTWVHRGTSAFFPVIPQSACSLSSLPPCTLMFSFSVCSLELLSGEQAGLASPFVLQHGRHHISLVLSREQSSSSREPGSWAVFPGF